MKLSCYLNTFRNLFFLREKGQAITNYSKAAKKKDFYFGEWTSQKFLSTMFAQSHTDMERLNRAKTGKPKERRCFL